MKSFEEIARLGTALAAAAKDTAGFDPESAQAAALFAAVKLSLEMGQVAAVFSIKARQLREAAEERCREVAKA